MLAHATLGAMVSSARTSLAGGSNAWQQCCAAMLGRYACARAPSHAAACTGMGRVECENLRY